MHLAARDQIAEVDGEEARVLEKRAHLASQSSPDRKHPLAPASRIGAEQAAANVLAAFTTGAPPTGRQTSLDVLPSRSRGSKSFKVDDDPTAPSVPRAPAAPPRDGDDDDREAASATVPPTLRRPAPRLAPATRGRGRWR